MPHTLNLIITISAFCACAGLAAFADRRARRPADPLRPRLVNWRIIMVLAAAGCVLALVHLVNLFGMETGPEHSPFGRL